VSPKDEHRGEKERVKSRKKNVTAVTKREKKRAKATQAGKNMPGDLLKLGNKWCTRGVSVLHNPLDYSIRESI